MRNALIGKSFFLHHPGSTVYGCDCHSCHCHCFLQRLSVTKGQSVTQRFPVSWNPQPHISLLLGKNCLLWVRPRTVGRLQGRLRQSPGGKDGAPKLSYLCSSAGVFKTPLEISAPPTRDPVLQADQARLPPWLGKIGTGSCQIWTRPTFHPSPGMPLPGADRISSPSIAPNVVGACGGKKR